MLLFYLDEVFHAIHPGKFGSVYYSDSFRLLHWRYLPRGGGAAQLGWCWVGSEADWALWSGIGSPA